MVTLNPKTGGLEDLEGVEVGSGAVHSSPAGAHSLLDAGVAAGFRAWLGFRVIGFRV